MKNNKKILLAAIAALVLGSISALRAGGPGTSHDPIASNTEAKATTNSYHRLSDAELIKKARKVDGDCLNHAQRPNTVLSADVQTTYRGMGDCAMRIVRFSLDPACQAPPCPLFASQLISEVDFGWNDQVIAIKCFVKE